MSALLAVDFAHYILIVYVIGLGTAPLWLPALRWMRGAVRPRSLMAQRAEFAVFWIYGGLIVGVAYGVQALLDL